MKGQEESNLKALIGNKTWKSLPEKVKERLLKEYEQVYTKETSKIKDIITLIRRQRRDQALLLIGAVFGILGSFLTSAIDRIYASNLGMIYNVVVIVCSLGCIFFIMRFFNNHVEEVFTEQNLVATIMNPPQRKRMKKLKIVEEKASL